MNLIVPIAICVFILIYRHKGPKENINTGDLILCLLVAMGTNLYYLK